MNVRTMPKATIPVNWRASISVWRGIYRQEQNGWSRLQYIYLFIEWVTSTFSTLGTYSATLVKTDENCDPLHSCGSISLHINRNIHFLTEWLYMYEWGWTVWLCKNLLNYRKSSIPALLVQFEVLTSTTDKSESFTRKFPYNLALDSSGVPTADFPPLELGLFWVISI